MTEYLERAALPLREGFWSDRVVTAICRWARLADLSKLATLDGVIVLGLGGLGALELLTATPLGEFNLNREANLPAGFSTALLFVAGLLAATLASLSDPPARRRSVSLTMIAVLFGFMAIDEGLAIHEHAGGVASRIGLPETENWAVYYLPVLIAAAGVWLVVLRELWPSRAVRLLWIGGAALWAGSQVLELIETVLSNETGTPYDVMVVLEEIAEMAGSSLFAFAMLVALRGVIAADSGRAAA